MFSVGSPLMRNFEPSGDFAAVYAPTLLRSSPTTKSSPRFATPAVSSPSHGIDHGGDDALGVAGAAAPDVVVVFARGEERRHGIDVRREGDDGRAPMGEDVETPLGDGHFLDRAAVLVGEGLEVLKQELANLLFVVGYRFDVDQRPCELEYVHTLLSEMRFGEEAGGAGRREVAGRVHPDSAPPVLSPDDSGQVLTLPPNRSDTLIQARFRRNCLSTPFAGCSGGPELRRQLLIAAAPLPRKT